MNAAEFVSRLGAKGKPRQTLSGWQCCCPAHEDKSPSLSVFDGNDGSVGVKCYAGCTTEAICAAVGLTKKDLQPPRPASGFTPPAKPVAVARENFDWPACVAAFTDAKAQKLAKWRGYSLEFVRWVHAQNIVGIFEGKLAFANHGDGGTVVCAHFRRDDGTWRYKPSGHETAPLIFGDAKAAGFVLVFESQWDAFAVMEKFGWHTANGLPDTAVLITRGASNGKLICGQLSPGAVCYAFKQNDLPTEKKPIPAGDVWLGEIVADAGCKVLNVATPAPHKDANDWTRAGATKADLDAAIAAAKLVQAPAPPDTATAKPVASSSRGDMAREYLGGEAKPPADNLPDLIDAAEFLAVPIEPPDELVAGILHKGSKLAFGGSSKSFKTWSLLDLAISVAGGVSWLGRETAQGRVLFVNFEIQPHPWQRRIAVVAQAKGVEIKAGQIVLWNLRGHAADFKKLIPRIVARCRQENFALIVLDPIYKLYAGNTDENSAGDVAALLNSLEVLAVETGAAIAFGAHFAKGNAAGKDALDRISGSGVFARDPDSLLIFTKHEEDEAFTVETILRNFAPVPPFVVRWDYPIMRRDDNLDPAKLKTSGGCPVKHRPQDLLGLLPAAGLGNADWLAAAEEKGMSRSTFYTLRKQLKTDGKVLESVVSGKWQPVQPKETT